MKEGTKDATVQKTDGKTALKQKIRSLPVGPGVYQFKDGRGNVIYVGKARNLRQRVRQYFTGSSSDRRFFIHYLRQNTVDLEAISTASDAEALILENNLIKKLRPRFNIRLRDDKDYLCLRIDPRDPWPRLDLVRRPEKDGARYFGPYASGYHARNLYKFISRNFTLRTCSDTSFRSRQRPCLKHQIGRCLAPCVLPIDKNRYDAAVGDALMLLEGKTIQLKERLQAEMLSRSNAMEYEAAARLRDLIRAIDSLEEGQRVVDLEGSDTDVIGMARQMERVVIMVMFVRGGKVVGIRSEKFARIGSDDAETLSSFILQYYNEDRFFPPEILIPYRLAEGKLLEDCLAKQHGVPVKVRCPVRGKGRDLI